jgi:hypothetical protein
MALGQTRYALLVHLAWELRSQAISSSLLVPCDREPLLSVHGRRGQSDIVLAAQCGELWRLVWRGTELDARDLPAAARHIALRSAA